jgi:hypothetical protein
MYTAAEAAQPITGRGIDYKLFTVGLIPSMDRSEMQRVYRLLKEAREEGTIPWEWIVDETREVERVSTWSNPAEYARCVARGYRRDFWDQQPVRVMVVSEKGTVRGLLRPVLDHFAVGFQVMHGFSSATIVHDISEDDDGRTGGVETLRAYQPGGAGIAKDDHCKVGRAMSAHPEPRVFQVRLAAKPGSDAIRSLRSLLKLALRRFQLRCIDVEEIAEPSKPDREGV